VRAAPFLFVLLWSGGYPAAKVAIPHSGPMTLLALRFSLALAVLVPICLVLRPALPRDARQWRDLAFVGLLIQVVYFGLSYVAFDLGISAGGLALIVSLQPILVALLAPALAGERVPAARWLGLALGLTGAAIVIVARSAVEAESAGAIAAAIGALAAMSVATLYEKRHGGEAHPLTANVVQYALGAALLLPVALIFEGLAVDWNTDYALALGYLVVGNSLIGITLLLAMIRRGEASQVSALLFLVPPGAAILAWIVIDERMPLAAWPGLALAMAGVFVASRR
jgi:drug/metabolite transporter (DMT)-like permease